MYFTCYKSSPDKLYCGPPIKIHKGSFGSLLLYLMVMVSIIKIVVKDFKSFMDGIKASQPLRDKYAVTIVNIYRARDNQNQLFIISEYRDEVSASEYFNSAELASAMKQSGIIGEPEGWTVDKA